MSGQLDDDVRLRTTAVAHRPDPYIIDIIGPRPTNPTAGRLWDTTAHLHRHLTAFHERVPALGEVAHGAFTTSQDTIATAIQQLDHALNPAQIEPPSRSLDLGLSL